MYLIEGACASVLRLSLQNRLENICWKSSCKQRLRLPLLSKKVQSQGTCEDSLSPSKCQFVLPMLPSHLCLPHVPWGSSTRNSRRVLVENKSTCSVIQSGHASHHCPCCTGLSRLSWGERRLWLTHLTPWLPPDLQEQMLYLYCVWFCANIHTLRQICVNPSN